MQSYRKLLGEAFLVTWKNKFLWIFGFFASFTSFNIYLKISSQLSKIYNVTNPLWQIEQRYRALFSMTGDFFKNSKIVLQNDPKYFFQLIFLMILFFAIIISVFWLSIICQVSVFKGLTSIENKKNTSLKNIVKFGIQSFWKVLVLYIFMGIAFEGILLLLVLPHYYLQIAVHSFWLSSILAVLFYFFVLFLGLIIILLYLFSLIEISKKQSSIFTAMYFAALSLKKNLLVCVEITVILLTIKVISAIIGISLVLLLEFPIILLEIIFKWTHFYFLANFFNLISIALFILFLFVYGSIIIIFEFSTWTIVYNRINNNSIINKLKRIKEHFNK